MIFAGTSGNGINWQCLSFEQLDTHTLYQMLQLRTQVFVVEQNCPYQDIDGKDFEAWHVLGFRQGRLVAIARILAPGVSAQGASIGRVITRPDERGKGLGQQLMRQAVAETVKRYPEADIELDAQAYLQTFYRQFEFLPDGDIYLEDGIEHRSMKRLSISDSGPDAVSDVPDSASR